MVKSVTVGGVVLTATGFKAGSKGKVVKMGEFYKTVDKGTARRIRKGARKAGMVSHASAPR